VRSVYWSQWKYAEAPYQFTGIFSSTESSYVISTSVLHHAHRSPDRDALYGIDGCATYGQLGDMIDALSREFDRLLPPGEAIGLIMSGTLGAVAALLAAERSGHPALLFSPSLAAQELTTLLTDSGLRRLLGPMNACLNLPGWKVIDVSTVLGRWTYRGGRTEDVHRVSPVLGEANALFGQLTSGSLGPSRFAVRSGSGVLVEIDAVARRLTLDTDDIVWCASSISHSYGLVGGLLAPLAIGASVALNTAPQPPPRLPITLLFGLATTYQALLRDTAIAPALATVRCALSAGAPLPGGLFDAFLAQHGVAIRQDCGTTETGTISLDLPDEPDPATVGAPLDHLKWRLADSGELLVRSPAVASHYITFGEPAPVLDRHGWFHTGDIAAFDGRRLRLIRRLRPLIPVPGGVIDPDHLERVLESLPGVTEAAVVPAGSGPHSMLRAVVVAASLDAAAVLCQLRERVPPAEVPDIVEVRSELPRSPAGKILRKYL